MKHFLFLAGVILVMFFQLSCGSDEEEEPMPEEVVEVVDADQDNYALPILSEVNLTSMYEAEVRELEVNSELQLITVLDETDKVSIKVKYMGIRDFNYGFPIYEFELIDPLLEQRGGIAAGMSGSPVGPPGRVMGALAYGNYYAAPPYRFWATAIDAMEEARDHRPFGEFMDAPGAPSAHTRWAPIKTPLVVSGINQRRVEDVSKRLNSSRFDAIDFVANVGGAPANAPAASGGLEAGDMIGVAIATGDVVNAIAYGTVTQVYDDGRFVAFGHSFQYDGSISLPVYRATTAGIVSNLQQPYKSSIAYGEPIGTLTKDLSAAVVGEIGEAPDMIPVTVSYHPVNSDKPIKTTSKVAYGQEWAIAPVVAWTADALRREYTHGTSDGKVVLSFEETKETYTQRWRNVSPDPFFDTYDNLDYAVGEFTDPLKNAAGKATLKSVSVEITDRPQLASTEIIDVKVPNNIRTGTQVTFTVVLLPHWSVAEDKRMIEKDISLNIPSDFETGSVTLKVEAQTVDMFDLIFDFDFDFDLDSDIEDNGPPQTLDELIKERQDRIPAPGTITVTLESNGSFKDIEEELILDDYIVTGEITDFISIE